MEQGEGYRNDPLGPALATADAGGPFGAYFDGRCGGLFHLVRPVLQRPVGLAVYECGPRRALGKHLPSDLDDLAALLQALRGSSVAISLDDRIDAATNVFQSMHARLTHAFTSAQGTAPSLRVELTAEYDGQLALGSGHFLTGVEAMTDEVVARLLFLHPAAFTCVTPAPLLPAMSLWFSRSWVRYMRNTLAKQLSRGAHVVEEWFTLAGCLMGVNNTLYNCMLRPMNNRRPFDVSQRIGDTLGQVRWCASLCSVLYSLMPFSFLILLS
jgi:hypothetical protein